jgi:hypothetical protein
MKKKKAITHLEELLEVYVDDEGSVCIAQRDMNEDAYLSFPPEHVDVLIKMLREQKKAALAWRGAAGRKD